MALPACTGADGDASRSEEPRADGVRNADMPAFAPQLTSVAFGHTFEGRDCSISAQQVDSGARVELKLDTWTGGTRWRVTDSNGTVEKGTGASPGGTGSVAAGGETACDEFVHSAQLSILDVACDGASVLRVPELGGHSGSSDDGDGAPIGAPEVTPAGPLLLQKDRSNEKPPTPALATCPSYVFKGDNDCTKWNNYCNVNTLTWVHPPYPPYKAPSINNNKFSVIEACYVHDTCFYNATGCLSDPKDWKQIKACNTALMNDVLDTCTARCVAAGIGATTCAAECLGCSLAYKIGTDLGGGTGPKGCEKEKEKAFCDANAKADACEAEPCVCDQCKANFADAFKGTDCTKCTSQKKPDGATGTKAVPVVMRFDSGTGLCVQDVVSL